MRTVPLYMIVALATTGCDDGDEATRVTLPVVVDASMIAPATNDLGYRVELTALTVEVATIGFTVEGETHSFLDAIGDFFIGTARAHPGHYAGGEVTGELIGPTTLDWFGADAVGDATLLPGEYHGANLELSGAAHLAGTATKDGRTVTWDATLDLPDPAVIVGAPLELELDTNTNVMLGVAFATVDPFEQDTVFDGLDFFALADAAGGESILITSGATAHNQLRRTFYTHDHFFVTVKEL